MLLRVCVHTHLAHITCFVLKKNSSFLPACSVFAFCIRVSLLMVFFWTRVCSTVTHKFIHEEHNNQTVERKKEDGKWEPFQMLMGWCMSVPSWHSGGHADGNTHSEHGDWRILSLSVCNVHAGLCSTDNCDIAAMVVTRERGEVFNCDSYGAHSSVKI